MHSRARLAELTRCRRLLFRKESESKYDQHNSDCDCGFVIFVAIEERTCFDPIHKDNNSNEDDEERDVHAPPALNVFATPASQRRLCTFLNNGYIMTHCYEIKINNESSIPLITFWV